MYETIFFQFGKVLGLVDLDIASAEGASEKKLNVFDQKPI